MQKILGTKERKTIVIIIGLLLLLNLSINLLGTGVTPIGGGDDHAFSKYLLGDNLWKFLKSRYTGWSSRLVIEVVLSTMTHITFLWRIFNTVAMFGVIYIPYYLIIREKDDMNNARKLMISYALFFMLPFKMFYETGWMATTTNYLWVLFAAELAMLPSLLVLTGRQIKKFDLLSIVSLIALVYAANQEQMVVILVLGNIALLGIYIYQHKRIGRILLQLVITGISLLTILLAPGNAVRKIKEVHWLPLFPTLSPFKKIELGFSSTLSHFFFSFDMLVLVILVLLLLIYINRKEEIACITIGMPIGLIVAIMLKDTGLGKIYPGLQKISTVVTLYGTNINFNDLQSWLPDIILILVSIIIVVGIMKTSKDQGRWIIVAILILGVLSRIMMGFSPTIWASGERTYLFLYESIICVCLYLYNQLGSIKLQKYISDILITIGFIGYAFVLIVV